MRALRKMIRALALSRFSTAVGVRLHAYRVKLQAHRLKATLKGCGGNVMLYMPVIIEQPGLVEIGDNVSLAPFVHIWGAGGVSIGARTMIGSHAALSSVTHDYGSAEMWKTVVLGPIFIGEDVWIGTHAVIMPGIRVGEGAVVGAGSVVTHDVDPFTIVAGVPARVLGRRNPLP